MIHNEAEQIKNALRGVEGVKSVTRGWPASLEAMPCIAIAKAADTPVEYRDDMEYLTELEYYVRIFSQTVEAADAIAPEVETQMESLGYRRVFDSDEDDGETRIQAMRYRKYV